jgi:CheY-like chemotaxis protein
MPTILIVDDESAVLNLTRLVLSTHGYTTVGAGSAAEALRAFAAADGEIDLLVTDVVMPVADGPALAAHLLELTPDLPVLFVSGYSKDLPDFGTARVRLLQKPFEPGALLQAVNSMLAYQPARPPSFHLEELRRRSAGVARRCMQLALKYEGLEQARKPLGQE